MTMDQAVDTHQERLMDIPGVSGIGIGDRNGAPVIVIMVRRLTPELRARLPRELEGHPVILEESGEIIAF